MSGIERTSRRSSHRLQRWVLGIPLVLMPLLLGGARSWLWSAVAAVFMLGLVLLIWLDEDLHLLQGLPKGWLVVLSVLLLWPFVQCIPLPPEWLAVISPKRFQWLQLARNAAGVDPWPASISYDALTTVFSGIWWLFLLLFALLFRAALRSGVRLQWLFAMLFILAGFEGFYGVLQVLIPKLGVIGGGDVAHHYEGYARGTFINRNHYACFLAMVWPVLIAYTLGIGAGGERREVRGERAEGRGQRVARAEGERGELSYPERERLSQVRQKQFFLWFVLGFVFLGLLFSASRGGILSAFVGMTVFVALGGAGRRKGILIFLVGCWVIVLCYGSIIGFDEILRRFDMMEKDAPGRFQIWETGWRIIQDHPWTGTGLGTFGDLFRVYQDYLDDKLTASFAHNDYVHLTVELGTPAAALLFVLAWGYWWRGAWRLARGQGRGARGEGVEGAGHRAEGGEQRVARADGEREGRGIADFEWRISQGKAASHESGGVNQTSASRRPGSLVQNEQSHVPGKRSHIRQSASNSRNPNSELRNLISVGALAGAAAFLCHCWVEFNWQIPANALYFVMLLVLLRGEQVGIR